MSSEHPPHDFAETAALGPTARTTAVLPRLRPMRPRDPLEPHRAASPLELFFDLVFVVAVSLSSQALHHQDVEGHVATGAIAYLMVFFAIWWAWMNFTWFATSFATDDWLYRVMTFVQMAGVLVLAAGAEAAVVAADYRLVTVGYVIMRLALVGQWLRAAAGRHDLRPTAVRFAVAITLVQVAWVTRLALPQPVGLVAFFALVAVEVLIPVWAERRGNTPWNARHIAERYGLFTLILLGESILASTNAVVEALHAGDHLAELLTISGFGLVIAAGMWWVYFAREHQIGDGLSSTLQFGYLHYVLFAAAGAFSAGIEVAVDLAAGSAELPRQAAAATLAVPVAVFLLAAWWLTLRGQLRPLGRGLLTAGIALVALSIVLPGLPIVWTGLGVAVAVLATELGRPDDQPETRSSRPAATRTTGGTPA